MLASFLARLTLDLAAKAADVVDESGLASATGECGTCMISITAIISSSSCGREKEAVLEHIFCVPSSTAHTVGCSSITKSAASVSYAKVLASESRSLSLSTGRIGIFTGKMGSTGKVGPEVGRLI